MKKRITDLLLEERAANWIDAVMIGLIAAVAAAFIALLIFKTLNPL